MDYDINGGNPEDISVFTLKTRGGGSIKSLEYMRQVRVARSVYPPQFDHGPEENLRRYNSTKPPIIDYSKIKSKIAIFNAEHDRVFSKEDTRAFRDSINQDSLVFYRDDYNIDHGGYISACNMSFFQDVLATLDKHLTEKKIK